VGTLVTIVLAIVGIGAAAWWYDIAIAAPWSHGDGPRLTRAWIGTVRTPSGKVGTLALDVHRYAFGGPRRFVYQAGRVAIRADARLCGLTPSVDAVTMYGTANQSASDVSLRARVPDRAGAGLTVRVLRGAWRGDTLELATVLVRAGHAPYRADDPDENERIDIMLRPADGAAFDAPCAGVP